MDESLPQPLGRADLDAIDRIRPQEWLPYRATFEHYFDTACCRPYGVRLDGRLVAMGTLIRFERSAWIAQLITAPEHRGQGLGSAVLTFLLAQAHNQGVETISLVATAQGQPLYTRAGFRVDGEYGFFHRADPGQTASDDPYGESGALLTSWTSRDTDAMAELDERASGERRRPYWTALQEGGWTVREGGKLTGFWLPRAGEELIVALTAMAGSALLRRRVKGADRVVVPLENPLAVEEIHAQGFKEVRRAKRMVIGPSLVRNPALLWSRIGGNLG